MKRILVFTFLVLTACAGPDTYHKSDGTQQEFDRDFNECLAQANAVQGMTDGWMGLEINTRARRRCMSGKGYGCSNGGEICGR